MEMMEGDDDNIDSPGPNQGVTGLNQGSQSVGRSVGRSVQRDEEAPPVPQRAQCCRHPMLSSPDGVVADVA